MKSDDTTIPNILEIKNSPASSLKGLVINTTSESRPSSSTDSSDSSLSDLRRRLEDLPSPNEFTLSVDREAALGRRICRKREIFLHGVANRIEENDEWEEREQRAGLESFLEVSRPKDARARRRARVRLESSARHDDETMVISQAGSSTGSFQITGNDDKLNPAESSVDRSARDDRLRLPMIAIPRGQSRPSSLSEPSSTRFFHHSNGESYTKCKTVSQSYRNFTPRDRASKSADLPSVSPFSFSGVQPKKFGGYRPPSGVILKNLSSGSESESISEMTRGLTSARKIGNTVATLELSSPESTAVSSVNGPIKKMPILSTRNITGSILPNLLPSSRSLDNDDLNHRIAQNTSQSYIGQLNRDGTNANDLGKVNTLVEAIFNEQASHGGFVANFGELRQVEPEYEDTRYQQQETPQVTSTFFTRSFMSESAKLATSTYNEQVIHNEPAMKAYNEFKRVEAELEGGREVGDYQCTTAKIHHDDIQNQFEFNCPISRANFEANSLEDNEGVLDIAEWNRSTNLYARNAVDTSHFIQNVADEALSSQTSEVYGSEDHSRSSCTRAAKIYLQKETLSSRKPQDTSDKCDREIITKVPTLALNSQDISCSTSAGSREYSATRPLDPHALIKALSDVSLKQGKQDEDPSRKREDFYRGKDTIDVSSRASDFPTKGETWRVPRFPMSPRKSPSHVPSRIPVGVSSSKIISPGDQLSECYGPESFSETPNYAESKFIEQNNVPGVTSDITQRPGTNSSYSQIYERDSSLRSWNKGIEVTVAEGAFVPGDETEFEINDRAPGSLTSSKLRIFQSTPFGDYNYDEIKHLPDGKFQGESCPPVFFHKAVYSSSRNYAKIDDDARSKSDRSTSRKSVNTSVDVTSATESPGLSKYKRTESSQIESLRNVEENVTWRTEDECASINDEDNPEDTKNKYYMSRDETPKGSYLRVNEHRKLATERTRGPPLITEELNSSSGIQKAGRKRHASDDLEFNDDKFKTSLDQNLDVTKIAQSENLTFQVCRTQEMSNFVRSSSTLNLNCEPKRRKKKSQERFPFTISEPSRVLSAKQDDASDYQSLDENLGRTKMNDQLQERTVYQLKTHPSVTRLATLGMEDTVADILCCVAQEKKEGARSSKSKIKALVRIFSWRLRKAPKQPADKILKPAEIIYENNACQADSKANSCSGDSTEETRRTYTTNRWIDHHAARSKTMLASSWETLKKTESLQTIVQEHLHRRRDRDDLWVRDVKDSFPDEKKDSEILQGKDEASRSKESPAKDRYSIFLAKNLQSDEPSISNRDDSPRDQHDVLISDHVTPPDGKGKPSIDREVPSNFIPELEETEDELTDCLCWRLCHIIAPPKYRSPIKAQVPAARTKGSDSLLQKRKK